MEYHSSREERLSTASSEVKKAYEKRNSSSFFKRNPQLKILLIDLILVCLFAGIILPFLLSLNSRVIIENYKIDTKAFIFEDKLLISLNFIPNKRKKSKILATEDLKVDILSQEGLLVSKSDSFPTESESFYISFQLDDNEKLDYLYINITTLDYNKDYKVKVKR